MELSRQDGGRVYSRATQVEQFAAEHLACLTQTMGQDKWSKLNAALDANDDAVRELLGSYRALPYPEDKIAALAAANADKLRTLTTDLGIDLDSVTKLNADFVGKLALADAPAPAGMKALLSAEQDVHKMLPIPATLWTFRSAPYEGYYTYWARWFHNGMSDANGYSGLYINPDTGEVGEVVSDLLWSGSRTSNDWGLLEGWGEFLLHYTMPVAGMLEVRVELQCVRDRHSYSMDRPFGVVYPFTWADVKQNISATYRDVRETDRCETPLTSYHKYGSQESGADTLANPGDIVWAHFYSDRVYAKNEVVGFCVGLHGRNEISSCRNLSESILYGDYQIRRVLIRSTGQ